MSRSRSRRGSRRSRNTSRWRTGSAACRRPEGSRAAGAASSSTRPWRASSTSPAMAPGWSGRDRDVGCGDRGGALARGRAHGRAVRRGATGDRELRRPEVALLPRARARGGRSRRRGWLAAGLHGSRGADAPTGRSGPRSRTSGDLECDLGQAGLARGRRVGAREAPSVPDRADAQAVGDARAAGGDRHRTP